MKKTELEVIIKQIIVEKTGYPEEVLENELDLEADLGIDSVKRMDIFSTLMIKLEIKNEDTQGEETQDENDNVKISTIQDMIDYCFNNFEI